MSSPGPPAVDADVAHAARDALAGMWDRFKVALGEQVAVIEEAVMGVLSHDLTTELRDQALREAHKLAGSLGTFGMPRGTEIAREVEAWFQGGLDRDPAEILRLSDTVMALRECLEAGPTPGLVPGTSPH